MRTRYALPSALASILLASAVPAAEPSDIAGKPEFDRRVSAPTVHLWSDGQRIYLRFAGVPKAGHFLGKVCSRGSIQQLEHSGLEADDTVALDPKQRCALLNLHAAAEDDSFSFAVPNAAVIVDLRLGADQLPAERIKLGAEQKPAESSPFTLNVAAVPAP